MSKLAWATFLSSIAITSSVIYFVYQDQDVQKARLRAGLAADEERRARKRKNIQEHEEQQALYQTLKSQNDIKLNSNNNLINDNNSNPPITATALLHAPLLEDSIYRERGESINSK